jgi:hypothetical protein
MLNVFLSYHEVFQATIENSDTAITSVYPLDAKLTCTLANGTGK